MFPGARFGLIVSVCVCAASNVAFTQTPSQYRKDVPATLAPVPAPDLTAVTSDFAKAYAQAKKPRIVVFWNRAVDDDLTTSYEAHARITNRADIQTSASVDAGRARRSAYADARGSGSLDQTIEAVVGVRNTEKPERASGPSESIEWQMLSGFQQPLTDAGATVVDRATIMRTSKAGMAADMTPNIQAIEATALAEKADLIIEVLMNQDSESPSGYAYRIEAKEVSTGRVVASFTSNAALLPFTKKYYANERGFVAAPPPADEVGAQLGLALMERLAAAWTANGSP